MGGINFRQEDNVSEKKKCIVMFSAGLDSVVAAHMMKEQGLDVTCLHFVLPFQSGLDMEFRNVKEAAEILGIPLRIEEEGNDFLEMVQDPKFGYGKNVNPCVDCRIHRLKKAAAIMKEMGADFLVTGEVVGQRPMSQHLKAMAKVEEHSGLTGKLLRPLSAKLLEPTIPEKEGWVDREKLTDIKGRGRKRQLSYAREYGLKHGTPGGGCLLTEKETTMRYLDMTENQNEISVVDFKLIAYGRHFRISDKARLIIGRNHSDNLILEKLKEDNDIYFQLANNVPGPIAIGRGEFTDDEIELAASLVARYSKLREEHHAVVDVIKGGATKGVTITPCTEEKSTSLIIGLSKI